MAFKLHIKACIYSAREVKHIVVFSQKVTCYYRVLRMERAHHVLTLKVVVLLLT